MTNYENAEALRKAYLNNQYPEQKTRNICTGKPGWNVCDYGDVYAGLGQECWKQGCKHSCIRCERVRIN